jgi:hypothetical protein
MFDYFLEVKATTTGEVRLTPARAQTASEQLDRLILCVVALRDVALLARFINTAPGHDGRKSMG